MCRIGFGPKSGMGNWGAPGEGKRMSRCRWTDRDQSGDINPCRGKGGKERAKKEVEEGRKKENTGRKKGRKGE